MEYFDIKKTANLKACLIGQIFMLSMAIIFTTLILCLPDTFNDSIYYMWALIGLLYLISLGYLIFNLIRFRSFFNTTGYLCTANVFKIKSNTTFEAEVNVDNKSYKVKVILPGPYFAFRRTNKKFHFSCTAYIRKEDYQAMKEGANFNYVGVLYNN